MTIQAAIASFYIGAITALCVYIIRIRRRRHQAIRWFMRQWGNDISGMYKKGHDLAARKSLTSMIFFSVSANKKDIKNIVIQYERKSGHY